MITPTVFPSEIPIYVGESAIPGAVRGIMASRDIKKGELIEKCPLIFIPISEEKYIKNTVIWKYYFEWTKKYHILVLGYGSLYNHSFEPNAQYSHDYKKNFLLFRAIKNIPVHEEIFVNYNWHPDNVEPLDPVHGIPDFSGAKAR